MRCPRWALVALLLVAVVVPCRAAEPSAEPRGNVKVTIRLGRLENGQRRPTKSYDLVIAPETPGSKLLAGARVPLPVGEGEKSEAGEGARFVYQNIGFSAEAQAWILANGKIKLMGLIEDSRLADRMLVSAAEAPLYRTERNEPYGPEDGVTHTLILHGISNGLRNVMIEVRNDLIADDTGQGVVADYLARLIQESLDA